MLIALFPLVSQSQNWTVGTPVNMVLNSNLFHSSGCFPTADQHFTVNGSTVSGVNYYLYVNSAPLDSVYIFPGMDTLAIQFLFHRVEIILHCTFLTMVVCLICQ